MIYGELREDGMRFVSWFPFHRNTIAKAQLPDDIDKIFPKWADPAAWSDQLDPDFLDYEYEDHGADGDPLAISAAVIARSPLFKTTVNVTLAVRIALRRYLGIEPALPDSETGNAHDG